MPWTCRQTETVRQTETEPEEEQAPQPQKTWKNNTRQGAVSLATSKATQPKTAWINPQTENHYPKRNAKACQAAITDNEISDEDKTNYRDPELNAWVCKGQSLPKDQKETIICKPLEVETGMLVSPKAYF